MESTPSSKIQNLFLWLATFVGFIVDAFTLIGIFSTIGFDRLVSNERAPLLYFPSQYPKIAVIEMLVKWKNPSLVVIIYSMLALVFFIRLTLFEIPSSSSEKVNIRPLHDKFIPQIIAVIWLHVVVLLAFFWVSVFFFPESIVWKYIYHIVIGWLLAVCFLVLFANWVLRSNDGKIERFFIKSFLLFVVLSPVLGLIFDFFFHGIFSFGAFFIIFFVSTVYTVLLISFTSSLLSIITKLVKLYYE